MSGRESWRESFWQAGTGVKPGYHCLGSARGAKTGVIRSPGMGVEQTFSNLEKMSSSSPQARQRANNLAVYLGDCVQVCHPPPYKSSPSAIASSGLLHAQGISYHRLCHVGRRGPARRRGRLGKAGESAGGLFEGIAEGARAEETSGWRTEHGGGGEGRG